MSLNSTGRFSRSLTAGVEEGLMIWWYTHINERSFEETGFDSLPFAKSGGASVPIGTPNSATPGYRIVAVRRSHCRRRVGLI